MSAKVAIGKLQVQKQAALLYVKGMTCPSCAIGIRVKLSKLDFVDGSRFKRGIEMDCNNQLLLWHSRMALVPTGPIEQEIDNAGYVAVEWFSMQKDELKSYPFLKVAE